MIACLVQSVFDLSFPLFEPGQPAPAACLPFMDPQLL